MNSKNDQIEMVLDSLFKEVAHTGEIPNPKDVPTIESIPVSRMVPFKDHPFKVEEGEELERLKESIEKSGVLVPVLLRPAADDRFEVISGHRRLAACKALGITEIPALVRELSDEEAVIAMVDANLQREHILPSEKAFAYKMKMDAMKKQGERTDLASTPVVAKFRTNEIVGKTSGDSREQVRRYIRLTALIPQLLDLVDEGKIAFRPAVELSYLTAEEQNTLLDAMDAEQCTPSLSQAQKLKELSQAGNLPEEMIYRIMQEQKSNQKSFIKIPAERIKEIIPYGITPKEAENFIIKACVYYRRFLEREADRDSR